MDHKITQVVTRLFFLLMSLAGQSLLLTGQCPEAGSVSQAIKASQIAPLRVLAEELIRCPQQQDSLADVYHKLGVLYNRSNLDSAIYFARKAVGNGEGVSGRQGTIAAGKAVYNLGEFRRRKGDFANAEPALQQSIIIFKKLPDEAAKGRLLRSQTALQQVYTSLGEYGKAEEVIHLVITTAKEIADTLSLAYALYDRADMLMKQGNSTEASRSFKDLGDSLSFWSTRASADVKPYLTGLSTYQQHSLGTSLMELGRYEEAEVAYHTAIPVFREWNDHDNLSRAYHDLTFQRIVQGNFVEAVHFLRLEKEQAEQSGIPVNRAYYHNNRGEYELRSGSPRSAAEHFQAAQSILVSGYQPSSPTDVPDESLLDAGSNLPLLLENLRDQARAIDSLIARGEGLKKEQLLLYRTADQIVDRMRSTHDAKASKMFWRKEVLPLYEAAIRLCHQLQDGDRAFYFFEKSKAVLLHEALLRGDALTVLPDSLRNLERQLSTSVENLSGAKKATDLDLLASTRRRLEELREQLRRGYPEYRALTELPELSRPAVFHQEVLAPSQQLYLHFLWGSDRVYVLALDGLETVVIDLGGAQQLEQLTRKVLTYFTGPTVIENDPAGYAEAAHQLYQALIAPLNLPADRELLVTPDGPLTYLPFSALLTEPVDNSPFGDWPYLLHRHAVSYTHSASILLRKRAALSQPASIAAYAPFTDGSSSLDYPVLSFSNDELATIEDRVRTKLYRDNEALASRLLLEREAGVLHLSTHAFSSPDASSPHIAFHDRLLYLDELYTAEITAELVVLSACQTNVGKLAPGEGVLGLGRGFVQAGAGSVVASLWNVNARAGGEVMAVFYDELRNNSPRGSALHLAQHRYLNSPSTRDRAKNPYYWASLTYYGPNLPLPLQSSSFFRWWWLLALASVLALIWIWARTQVR